MNSREIKAAARGCRVMALCVCAGFNSLAELRCVCERDRFCSTACIYFCLCASACVPLAVCLGDSGASSGFHLSCLSETIIPTPAMQMHTNTAQGQAIALSIYVCVCVCLNYLAFSHYRRLKWCSFINAIQCLKCTSKQGL